MRSRRTTGRSSVNRQVFQKTDDLPVHIAVGQVGFRLVETWRPRKVDDAMSGDCDQPSYQTVGAGCAEASDQPASLKVGILNNIHRLNASSKGGGKMLSHVSKQTAMLRFKQ